MISDNWNFRQVFDARAHVWNQLAEEKEQGLVMCVEIYEEPIENGGRTFQNASVMMKSKKVPRSSTQLCSQLLGPLARVDDPFFGDRNPNYTKPTLFNTPFPAPPGTSCRNPANKSHSGADHTDIKSLQAASTTSEYAVRLNTSASHIIPVKPCTGRVYIKSQLANELNAETSVTTSPARSETLADLSRQSKTKANMSRKAEANTFVPLVATTMSSKSAADLQRKTSLRQQVPRIITTMPIHQNVVQEITPHLNATDSKDTTNISSDEDLMKPSSFGPYQVSPATPTMNTTSNPSRETLSVPIPYQVPSPVSSLLPQNPEEPFGFAVIAPSSRRYSTYLPALKNHVLSTPPLTAETIHLLSKPPKDKISPTGLSSLPSYTIPRKPLPSNSLRRRDEVRRRSSEKAKICQMCRGPKSLDDGRCMCSGGKEDEEEAVTSGCLDALGWASLREKVLQRMRSKNSKDRPIVSVKGKKRK